MNVHPLGNKAFHRLRERGQGLFGCGAVAEAGKHARARPGHSAPAHSAEPSEVLGNDGVSGSDHRLQIIAKPAGAQKRRKVLNFKGF